MITGIKVECYFNKAEHGEPDWEAGSMELDLDVEDKSVLYIEVPATSCRVNIEDLKRAIRQLELE